MLGEALLALASAGGGAVVAAAGTDAWQGFRRAVAHWLGRGDARIEEREMERLNETAAALLAGEEVELERVRHLQQGIWQARFTLALESMTEAERELAARELSSLLAVHAPPGTAPSAPGGVAAGHDVHFTAEDGSVAAGVINGGVQMGPPSPPGPAQG
ncbi:MULTISPECIES: hypothetical protein [unclassified Streptomyces]|uniref:hypothetical protein n=1 Tax=Streptomyces sp. NBRC 14336 TaxID=3030992 RepID=UPI0025571F24|nr:hypothetical protein [Streptomyces sp. NBRC 14336]WBO81650.1 hypothetical protein SBE_005521 [Streptomyces sp. SBE_14.2]